ncbi:WhiB family transcriptional regulator (plasmid) [Rhodococcus sp. ZPP]|uniref:WhiB family transcriptional regulator n=1 Tax=Rhodococcus sp. ZPP TaxID=2749906 RepID=UPI001AD89AAA|nr:WhiB family transcriptional regulator [Rhodococcus sp. ZPP]QTJ70193.1 WhiB family transcriptional regulator [Rhodococcus sp. ZPP]
MPDHSHHHVHFDGDWQRRASCRGTDTDMFFSPDGERGHVRAQREHAAKQICQDCPVLTECRIHALTAAEAYGIWGGMSETDRARYTRRRTRLARRPHDSTPASRADPTTAHPPRAPTPRQHTRLDGSPSPTRNIFQHPTHIPLVCQ